MFSYERRIVSSLLVTDDPTLRREVEDFVDGALSDMAELLRVGIVVITVALTVHAGARALVGAPRTGPAEVAWLKAHPIGLVRQWVRALQSLVLFAENEKAEAGSCA